MRCSGCATQIAAEEACPRCGVTLDTRGSGDASADALSYGLSRAPVVDEAVALPGSDAFVGLLLEDRYRIERFLARGGMGDVYLGTDEKLQRSVAVKFLLDRLLHDETWSQRFLREARAVASLEHPNVVPVYSVGEHQGRPYMVMKFIAGHSLAEIIARRKRLPVSEAVAIVREACEGLAHIHRRGYVHRDIKPQNLMVEEETGRCIILDFGILRSLDSTRTTAGLVLGTPAYMSPEQAEDPRSADARSDLYSLGITFFEMLTGHLPFRARSALDLLFKHRSESPVNATDLHAGLPPEVDVLIAKCLAKTPEDRFQTAAQLGDAAEQLAGHVGNVAGGPAKTPRGEGPAPLPPTTPGERYGPVVNPGDTTSHSRGELLVPGIRRRRPWMLVGALALVATVISAWWLYRAPESQRPTESPVEPPAAAPVGPPSTRLAVSPSGEPAPATPAPFSRSAFDGSGTAGPTPPAPPPPQEGKSAATAPTGGESGAPASDATGPRDERTARPPAKAGRRPRRRSRTPSPAPPARPGKRAVSRPTEPSPALLSVSSQPTDALVRLNGERLGRTPLRAVTLPPGTYELEMQKPGYRGWRERLRLGEGERRRAAPVLVPLPGTLRILVLHRGRGTWASISIDGAAIGEARTVSRELPPGVHRVVARREGYLDAAGEITLAPGQTKKVTLKLVRRSP